MLYSKNRVTHSILRQTAYIVYTREGKYLLLVMSNRVMRWMMSGKIHRATVTDADLDYEGSITIDGKLLDLAGIWEGEKVTIANIANGNRFETYTIRGEEDSGEICINGAAAHLCDVGDLVIIIGYELTDVPVDAKIVLVDGSNKPVVK